MDMELQQNQYTFIQYMSGIVTGQCKQIVTAQVGLLNSATGSIDTVLAHSGSALRSADIWSIEIVNPTGSLLNGIIEGKDYSIAAIEAIVMLSGSFSVAQVSGSI